MSKYSGLAHLLKGKSSAVTLTFDEIAAVVPGGLPASAFEYSAWWANEYNHSQAKAWMDAGWATSETNLTSRKVTFTPR